MIIKSVGTYNADEKRKTITISAICPNCRQLGSFTGLLYATDVMVNVAGRPGALRLGIRICPNPNCRAVLFTVQENNNEEVLVSYPSLRIDFDSSNIPDEIVACLKEAITCHANECYIASGIMIRKTLEVMCEKQGATGATLNARLKALATKVTFPVNFLSALDDLRLMGNDAAHIESRTFNQIGKEEVEISIDITKRILEALYQYDDLMARLSKFKKSATAGTSTTP